MVPSDPYTAKGIQLAAMRDDDPVIIFQCMRLMGLTFDQHVPEEPYEVPIGRARVVREGTDVTLVGIGFSTQISLMAAAELEGLGHSVEVVDLLSLSPLDEETVLASISKDPQGRRNRRGLPALLCGLGHIGARDREGLRFPGRPARES